MGTSMSKVSAKNNNDHESLCALRNVFEIMELRLFWEFLVFSNERGHFVSTAKAKTSCHRTSGDQKAKRWRQCYLSPPLSCF